MPRRAGAPWAWTAAILAATVVGGALARTLAPTPEPSAPPVRRFVIEPRPHRLLAGSFAVSPDGAAVVYEARGEDGLALYLRSLDQVVPRVIPGTEDGFYPMIAPDGQWLAFFSGTRLRKVALSSSAAPVTLAEVPEVPIDHSVAWFPDDTIVLVCAITARSVPEGCGACPRVGEPPVDSRRRTARRARSIITRHTPCLADGRC